MADVFISYSRKDKALVQRLDEALRQRERQAWVDWEGIRPTEEFMQAIEGAIEGADTFIFVLSPDSIASPVCGKETAHAVTHNKRMVPLVARDVNAAEVPESLAKLNWIFCRDVDDFYTAVNTLITALNTDLEWVRAHTRLLMRAVEWETKGKNSSFVLRGDDLREAESWLTEAGTDKERQPTALQTEYIIASRKAEVRRQRAIRIWVSVAAVIALVLAALAWTQRTKALSQEALARNTAVQADFDLALNLRGDGPTTNPRMLPHLARALRVLPDAALPRHYLISLLRDRSWILPKSEPLRHRGEITAAIFSPDGRRLVTTSADKTARLWDVETGQPLSGPLLHNSKVVAAAFSPDGHQLVTCSASVAHFWDATTGASQNQLSFGMGDLSFAQWSPDEMRILLMGSDSTLGVWDTQTMKRIGEPLTVRGISPDGKRAWAVGHEIDSFQLWNTETMQAIGTTLREGESIERSRSNNLQAIFSANGQRLVILSGAVAWIWEGRIGRPIGEQLRHPGELAGAAFTSDGRLLVTCCGEIAQIWDADTGLQIGEPLRHGGAVSSPEFNADGTRLLTLLGTGNAELWDCQSRKRIGEGLSNDHYVRLATFSPDGTRIITVGDKTVRVWDAQTAEPVGEPLQGESVVASASFSPDSQNLLIVCLDSTVGVWDVPRRQTANAPLPLCPKASVMAFSPDGRRLAVGSTDGIVRLYDAENGHPLEKALAGTGSIDAIAFTPDGSLFATGSNDHTARIWDAGTGRQRGESMLHDTGVKMVGFSADGKLMLSRDFNARLWDVKAGKLLQVLGPPYATKISRSANVYTIDGAALSPNGHRIVTISSSGTVQVSNVDSGEIVSEGSAGADLVTLTFSPDGDRILTAAADGAVNVWKADTWQSSGFSIHHGNGAAACFSPGGQQILTWSSDKTACLWDAQTGEQLGETMRHQESVDFAGFTAGGKVVVTRSADGSVRLWDAETGKSISERLPCRSSLRSAIPSPDGRHIATIGDDGESQLWDVTVDLKSPLPSWVPELAEALGNRRLNERSTLVPAKGAFPNSARTSWTLAPRIY